MRSKSDGAKVLYQVDDDSPGDHRTRAVMSRLECECPRYGGSWLRWHSGGHGCTRRWMSWVPHIVGKSEKTSFICPREVIGDSSMGSHVHDGSPKSFTGKQPQILKVNQHQDGT